MHNGESKKCPFCGEVIKQVANRCKHCKSYFGGGLVTAEYCGQHEPVEPELMIDHRCPKFHI